VVAAADVEESAGGVEAVPAEVAAWVAEGVVAVEAF
jgi:hypothetical protein